MDYLELASVVCGLCCVVLAGRNKTLNFYVGYLYNILLFALFWRNHLYAACLLQPVAFCINAFGHYRWTHPRSEAESAPDGKSLRVSALSGRQVVASLLAGVTFWVVWGFVLSKLGNTWFTDTFDPDPNPWLDAFVLAPTLLAQYLSAQKKWECWIVWLFVNILNITLYLKSGLLLMPIVCGLYIANGLWSLLSWYKLYKNHSV